MRVFKRGNIWWIDYFYGGRRIRESAGTTNKKRAKQLLAKRLSAVFENRFDLREISQHQPLFSTYADHYLENYSKLNKRPQTHQRDQGLVKHLKVAFGKYLMGEITPEMIEKYKKARLNKGRRPATVNREVACLKNMYNVAIRDKKVVHNPVRQVKLLKENNEVTNPLTRGDEKRLLDAAAPHIRAIIICALDSGMRLAEILDLRWDAVDFKTQLITVKHSKTGKRREIPITTRLQKTLKGLPIGKVVFWWKDGEPIGSVKKGYKAAVRRAGLIDKKYRFHDLRHTYATRLIHGGADPFTVMQLLGHASITTTQRYAHPNLESKRRAVARLSEEN